MEEQRENIELNELREQVALLKEKLQRQQIISEQQIIATAQKGISKLNRMAGIWGIFGIFAVLWCSSSFYHMGFSEAFVIGTAILLALCAVVTIYAHLIIHSVDVVNGNLVEILFESNYKHELAYNLHRLKEYLNEPKNESLEDIYWELAGVGDPGESSQLLLVGMMLDRADVEITDDLVRLHLYKELMEI